MSGADLLGPFFNHAVRQHAFDSLIEDIKDQVSAQALADVQEILDQNIKRPTPYYETQINIKSVGEDRQVNDRDVVYGPWLEGISYRNEVTRFKGYHAFRLATERANTSRTTGRIITAALRRAIARLNS